MSAVAALDANVLIYILDDASPFSPAAQTLLKRLEKAAGQVYVSVIARTEILHQPYQISSAIGDQAKRLLDHFDFVVYVEVTKGIADKAAELCALAGAKLKNIDSIHLATALHAGANEFWTNDRELAKVTIEGMAIKLLSNAK